MAQKLLKKISVATFLNPKKGEFKEATKGVDALPLMRVVGVARKFDTGISSFGEFIKFVGEFHATSLYGANAGEIGISSVCFLPAPVDGLLREALEKSGNDGKSPVEFAFDISIVHDEKGENGYQYRVDTLVDTKVSSPLESLIASVSKQAPAIAHEVKVTAAISMDDTEGTGAVAKGVAAVKEMVAGKGKKS